MTDSASAPFAKSIEYLYTNHFTCVIGSDIPLYEYDISVEEINETTGEWRKIQNRFYCGKIVRTIIANHQLYPNVFVWLDENQCLYSTQPLYPQCRCSDDGRNRLNIGLLSAQWSTADIHSYIRGHTTEYPRGAVRTIEALLKASLADRVRIVKSKFYFLNDVEELGDGFIRRRGCWQALNLSSHSLTLNLETKATRMFCPISLLLFVRQQIGADRMPTANEYTSISRMLRNCVIVLPRSKGTDEYVFDRIDYRRAYEISLENGETLVDYCRDELHVVLTAPNYPCAQVHARNKCDAPLYLPLEVCMIKPWQVCDEYSADRQREEKHIRKPEERYHAIVEKLCRNCDYNAHPLCRAVGFSVTDKDMLELKGHVLRPPTIKTGLHNQASIDTGRYYLAGEFHVPKQIPKLAVTYFGRRAQKMEDVLDNFINQLVDMMEGSGIYGHHEKYYIRPSLSDIDAHFRSMLAQDCKFIVCVMDADDDAAQAQLRLDIKRCGTLTHGIVTQCASIFEIAKNVSLKEYCDNLIRKINFKNGGINGIVELYGAQNIKCQNDSYMFFGGIVRHSNNITRQRPSIAALVGSGNSSCSTTAMRVSKQYPREGSSSIDIIVGMTEMVDQLLEYYHETNAQWPTKIVFYREGMDDEHFRRIQEIEIPAIRQAFTQRYGDSDDHPRLTLIGVSKQHNTRFFTFDPALTPSSETRPPFVCRIDNMSIGCVIDTTKLHSREHTFFLNSHNTPMGVNHPPLYRVLLDEIGFRDSELQLLTYQLCYTDPRSSMSESVPSVLHQAEVAGRNARDLFEENQEHSADDSPEGSRPTPNLVMADFDYEILQVHATLMNKPVLS